jgi:hypothetical protein
MHSRSRTRSRAVLWTIGAATFGCGQTTVSVEDVEPSSGIDLERGLVAYLPLDEPDPGSVALDASGHGHDGAPSPNPPLPSASVPPVGFANPRSLAFNGVDQLLDLGNPVGLNISGEITLAAWTRPLALDGFRNIIAHGWRRAPNEEVALRIHDDAYEFTTWNSIDHRVIAPIPAGDVDNWHHVAGVYEGDTYKLYRDGELIAEQTETFAPTTVDAPWAIGGRLATTPEEDRPFSGLIDDVRVYERALSSDEVRALFRR